MKTRICVNKDLPNFCEICEETRAKSRLIPRTDWTKDNKGFYVHKTWMCRNCIKDLGNLDGDMGYYNGLLDAGMDEPFAFYSAFIKD